MLTGVWIGIGLLIGAAVAYWLLVLSEGTYLGPKAVSLLYDLTARRYDRVKQYEIPLEDATLGEPLAVRLGSAPEARVLDVATGTGRMAMSLLRQAGFRGHLVGLDLSAGMLQQAARNLADYGERVAWIRHDAGRLPFEEGVFDAVTCLEALEFLPDPRQTLGEMVRVLRPGGTLLFTNRIGIEAAFLPGKVLPRDGVEEALAGWPLGDVIVSRWEVNYDQVWARRDGQSLAALPGADLVLTAPCPTCGAGPLALSGRQVSCQACGATLGADMGIVDLVNDRREGIA